MVDVQQSHTVISCLFSWLSSTVASMELATPFNSLRNAVNVLRLTWNGKTKRMIADLESYSAL